MPSLQTMLWSKEQGGWLVTPYLGCYDYKSTCGAKKEKIEIVKQSKNSESHPFLLQKTAFSLVKSRLALGSPVCCFVRSFVTILKMAQYTQKWLSNAP